MKNRIILILCLFLPLQWVMATHQRAGEITYRHISGLTYEFTILTYTFAPSPADRPELLIEWGDGSSDIIPRVERVDFPDDIRRNVYRGQHTYSGPNRYIISVEDPNRNYGVINIPNSVNVPLYIETELIINPFLGPNNSPVLTIPPIDNGCVSIPYLHNPGAYDPDGDSLSYRLIDCKGAGGLNIPGYTLPPASTSFALNPITGDLLWDAPTMQGEFNIAILIEEWRNGIKIGSVTRDMQITIVACNQHPPVLDPLPDTCVTAGTFLSFPVTATDPDGDMITLTGTGAPLQQITSPASFDTAYGLVSITGLFVWQTHCQHVRKLPYTMYFKAQDDGLPVRLVDIETMRITVVGPAPENLKAEAFGNGINLQWDKSPCPNASGYSIYRRIDSSGFIPDHCETGVPAYTGYQKIGEWQSVDSLFFRDEGETGGLAQGVLYCYLVVANYPDGAESYASNEACASLKRDVPIIINNSVERTHTDSGRIFLRWVQPTELDMTQTPGPFRYRIHRAEGSGAFVLIDSLDGLTDTTYVDSLLNTTSRTYSYNIELINLTPGNVFSAGFSGPATSVFLNITPTDESLLLEWSNPVPWTNYEFVVYKLDESLGAFLALDTIATNSYTDTGLVNGQVYCYKVETFGAYGRPDLPTPLINWSQENCGEPLDNVAPCKPRIWVKTDCDIPANIISWNALYPFCPEDIERFEVYYSPREGEDPGLLATVYGMNETTFTHQGAASIAGCYYVVAIDSIGNQSPFSDPHCIDIDSCNLYELPNVFTPNGDAYNDLFVPFPYNSVLKVEMTIFNRWGGVVYETEDPDILWDGKHKDSQVDCSQGVYYYVCEVYEIRLDGPAKRRIQGVVHLLR